MYVYIYVRMFREKSYANTYESLCILCFQNSNIFCFEMNILFIPFINRMSQLSPCTLHIDHYCGAISHSGLIKRFNDGMAYLLSIKPNYFRTNEFR